MVFSHLRFTLVLCCRLHQSRNGLYPLHFPIKIAHAFLILPLRNSSLLKCSQNFCYFCTVGPNILLRNILCKQIVAMKHGQSVRCCRAKPSVLPSASSSLHVKRTDRARSRELNEVWLTEEAGATPFICNLQPSNYPSYTPLLFHRFHIHGSANKYIKWHAKSLRCPTHQ
jgi:hypothetical protein